MDLVIKRREASEEIEMNKKVRVMKGSGETERINGGKQITKIHTNSYCFWSFQKEMT